jgi:hypothetical protein
MSYKTFRIYRDRDIPNVTVKTGLTLEEAKLRCIDPETSSRTAQSDWAKEHTAKYGPWFEGWTEES